MVQFCHKMVQVSQNGTIVTKWSLTGLSLYYQNLCPPLCSCNRTESSTITEEIQTSKFKAKKSNEPVGRVLIFALNLRV